MGISLRDFFRRSPNYKRHPRLDRGSFPACSSPAVGTQIGQLYTAHNCIAVPVVNGPPVKPGDDVGVSNNLRSPPRKRGSR